MYHVSMRFAFVLMLMMPPSDSREALATFGAARLKQKRGELPAAQSQLQKAITLDPAATEPLRALLDVQASLTRYAAAIRTGQLILERDPKDVGTALKVGQLLVEGNRFKDAKKLLLPLINETQEPATMIDLLSVLAKACEKSNDGTTAEIAHRQRTMLFSKQQASIIKTTKWNASEYANEHAAALEQYGQALIVSNRPLDAAEVFMRANELYLGPGQYPKAAVKLDWNLAKCYVAAGDLKTALKHYDFYLKANPGETASWIEAIDRSFDAGRGQEIMRKLDPLWQANPKQIALGWLLTIARLKQGDVDHQAAIMSFEEWAKTKIDPVLMAAAVANVNDATLVDWFDSLAKRAAPEHDSKVKKEVAMGPILRGLSDAIRKDTAKAKRFVHESLGQASRERHHRVYEFAGWLAERSGQLAEAEKAMRLSASGNWERSRPLLALLERQSKWQKVVEWCQPFLSQGSNIEAQYVVAYAHAELGNVAMAMQIVDRLSRDERLFAEGKFSIRLQQCRILTAAGQHDRSIEKAKSLFDMANNPAEIARVRMALGDALFSSGQVEEGEKQMRAILETDPDDALALNNLAYNLAEHGRQLADAELFSKHANDQDRDTRLRSGDPAPASGTYLDTLAWVYYKRGKLLEAKKTLEEALTLPDASFNPVIWDHLGDVMFKLDEPIMAVTAWQRALLFYPKTSEGRRSGKYDAVEKKIAKIK